MKKEHELKLQERFNFMKQNHSYKETNRYKLFGCGCNSGWYNIIYDCCLQIEERYKKEGIPVDFQPVQIKEKFGALRIYYEYLDAPCKVAAFDFLGIGSMRFKPGMDEIDDNKRKLHEDIYFIVKVAEERSKSCCEYCGSIDTACLRKDTGCFATLCDTCYRETDYESLFKESRKRFKEIYDEIERTKEV